MRKVLCFLSCEAGTRAPVLPRANEDGTQRFQLHPAHLTSSGRPVHGRGTEE